MKTYTPRGYTDVYVAEIPADEIERVGFDLCAQPRQTIDAWRKAQADWPEVVSNAGFFDMGTGNTLGTVIHDKRLLVCYQASPDGIGTVDGKSLLFGRYNDRQWDSFVGGYPVYMRDCKADTITTAKELNYRTRRTCLGINEAGTVFLVCVEAPGMNFGEMQRLFARLGCSAAINLDGGGSTRLLINGKRKTKNVTNRPVDSVFYVKLKFTPWQGTVTRSVLNLRSGPSARYELLGKLKKGASVTILQECDGWGRTQAGWVHLGYVKKI